jgi:hypothetical protein
MENRLLPFFRALGLVLLSLFLHPQAPFMSGIPMGRGLSHL